MYTCAKIYLGYQITYKRGIPVEICEARIRFARVEYICEGTRAIVSLTFHWKQGSYYREFDTRKYVEYLRLKKLMAWTNSSSYEALEGKKVRVLKSNRMVYGFGSMVSDAFVTEGNHFFKAPENGLMKFYKLHHA